MRTISRRSRLLLAWAALFLLIATVALRSRSDLARVYAGAGRPRPDPAPVLTPAQALGSMQAVDGMRVTLAAAEPMVEAPIAGQFDEDGRLWVVEMPTYMRDLSASSEATPGGRVVVLQDRDHDGAFDARRVFLEGLILARAVSPCYGGALVIEPPNLLFWRDIDGDGRADERRVLLTGVGAGENPEHAGNGLIRGIDNWYHLSQERIEFRFDGTSVITRPTPGHGQWGLSQDDFGRLYYTPNSNPLLTDYYPKHYGAGTRAQGGAPGIGQDICKDGTTWPAHATRGVNRGYMENVLRPDGTLASVTAACGTLVNRAGTLGESLRGDAFICESAGNLVKRLALREHEGWPRAENIYRGTEFLRSTDERFRPVNLCQGPDGALYVLDMYRGLIQHKTYVTPFLARQVKERALESPLILGRVYRVCGATAREPRRLSRASDEELVALLRDADGWWRDTAQRLLVERRATGVAASVRAIAQGGPSPASRVQALWTLEGLGSLTWEDAQAAMRDADAPLRRAGARLAEMFIEREDAIARIAALADDPDRQVRVQAAASLGALRTDEALKALAGVLRRHGPDRVMRGAVISGLAKREAAMLSLMLDDLAWPRNDGERAVLNDLTDVCLRDSDEQRAALAELVGRLASAGSSRAGQILARMAAAQRLETPGPRPLKLSVEPAAWLKAAESQGPLAAKLKESADYMDWPGRPPVKRRSVPRELTPAEQARFVAGRQLYAACIGCHQPDGTGSVGMAPGLAGSSIVLGAPERLANVLLFGMEGPYTMLEMEFDGVMVPVPMGSDEDLAAVLTYIRRAFGNDADPIDAELVARVRLMNKDRTKPWTRSELEAQK